MSEKIKWLEWDKNSFNKAKKEVKPILLDISAVWCHWCHQMEKNTYSNKEIAEITNKDFIPIKVDTDRRPDINERYNQGGWPTTALLTATGKFITGGTYFPPERLKLLLQLTKKYYDENRQLLEAEPVKEKINLKPVTGNLERKTVDEIVNNIVGFVDMDYGGFGIQPKFPFPELIELLILQYKKTKDNRFLKLVTITLDGMLGIYDNAEGGFYRYSVTREWNTPHFEKLLDVNAKLVVNYLHGFEITKDEKYKKIALETLDYIEKNLLDKKKFYFSGSQDADEEYYKLDKKERGKMKKPSVDKNVFTNLNCLAISTFLEASVILRNRKYQNIALKSIEFLLKNCYKDGMCHYYDKKPQVIGLFTDQVAMIDCLIKAYKVTKNKKYLTRVEKLIKYLIKNFQHKESEVFFDKINSFHDVGYLKQRSVNFTDNLVLAENLATLSKRIENKKYRKIAERILLYFTDKYQNYGVFSGLYALALERYFNAEGKTF